MPFTVSGGSCDFEHSDTLLPYEKEHRHTRHEWVYLLSGDVECMIDYHRYAVKPHTLIMIPPGQLHRLRPLSEKPVNRYILRFPEAAVPAAAQAKLRGLGSQYVVPGTLISEEIQRMDIYVSDLPPDRIADVLYHQLCILLHFACNFIANRQTVTSSVTQYGKLIDYINTHLTGIHSLADISANVHMSPSSIRKIFREELRKPVMTYVREQKCLLAQNHLLKGFQPGDVCQHCGFASYSTFYRSYLRTFGVPPSGDASPDGPSAAKTDQ